MGERRMNKNTETRKKKEERKKVISGAKGHCQHRMMKMMITVSYFSP